ncbi:DUF4843 domain-containing protein [Chitinophaga nivalis]|uniref:DUF4843 domain-containing protein n=1 Tax=Chitinophaga nivalis TaxID=2991709 RepID=A0ABT3IJL6_9BACT|nr:DUF4843 domain-containing protein [Chitinophaga nivalis]MCW3466139.1 DUF4843 domain-containing protein [Chitinophaga nivalis]MCW3484170.1 DUF4843 domain-containing protein [Chitinophaga nivalis]
MKKLAIISALALLAASCTQDAGLTYSGKDKIYFTYNYTLLNQVINFDKVTFSFGMKPEQVIKDTAKIAVRVMGQRSDKDRQYRLSIDNDSTTAIPGVHYEVLPPLQTFQKGIFEDTLRIVVLRSSLNGSHITQENRRLRLRMESSDDFDNGTKQGAAIDLYINNYLSEPRWWKQYEGSGLYYYHPEKWKILMTFHDNFKDPNKDYPMDANLVYSYFSSLRNYLIQNPTYDKETRARVLIDKLVP